MKKVFVGILAIIYMAVSSGIAMQIHYCMGKKAGVDFFSSSLDKKCSKCGMKEKKGGCCHDEHKFFKLEDSHKNVTNDIDFSLNEINVVTTYPLYDFQTPTIADFVVINNNSPPNYTKPDACIMNCVFRI